MAVVQGRSKILCESPVKMWIADVLKLQTHPLFSDRYEFRGKALKKVDVCGIVIDYRVFESRIYFHVDDTTGALLCTFRKPVNVDFIDKPKFAPLRNVMGLSPTSAQRQKMKVAIEIFNTLTKPKSNFKIGDCVQVRGFLNYINGIRRISAFEVYVMTLDEEIDAIFEKVTLYASVYTIPSSEECSKRLKK